MTGRGDIASRTLYAAWTACLVALTAAASATDINPPSLHSDRGAWPIRRQWTVEETRHFAEWIQHIYEVKTNGTREQQIARLERVLTDPEMNLLLDPEFAGEGCNGQLDLGTIRALHSVVDCAKLTVTFSSYYAYRRGLPWMVNCVRACDGGDVRTAEYTIPAGVMSSFDYASAGAFFRDAVTCSCTGNFRVELGRKRSELSDTLPVALTRDHLIPGCLFYQDGHVLLLASVTAYGEPRFLDATVAPSRDIYAFNGLNAVFGIAPARSGAWGRKYAGCFRGFRVYRWPLAEANEDGKVVGVRRRTDDEMREFGYSPEQYDVIRELTDTQRIVENGVVVDSFHQFLRLRLRTATRVDPIADIGTFAVEMLALLKEREQRVQEAWRDVSENGPVMFPEGSSRRNVYTAQGRWGRHATALSDAMIRGRFVALANDLDNAIVWFERNADEVVLDDLNKHAIWCRGDLACAVLYTKNRIFADTVFEYTDSKGRPVRVTLLDVEKRLYDLSFDPNHPPELRWGMPLDRLNTGPCARLDTPLPEGDAIPMEEAYQREAYYRSLAQWEPDQSYLREMFTKGFPVHQSLEQRLRGQWCYEASPPLVPHNGKAAWLKEAGTAQTAYLSE